MHSPSSSTFEISSLQLRTALNSIIICSNISRATWGTHLLQQFLQGRLVRLTHLLARGQRRPRLQRKADATRTPRARQTQGALRLQVALFLRLFLGDDGGWQWPVLENMRVGAVAEDAESTATTTTTVGR